MKFFSGTTQNIKFFSGTTQKENLPLYDDICEKIGIKWKNMIQSNRREIIENLVQKIVTVVDTYVEKKKNLPEIVIISGTKEDFANTLYPPQIQKFAKNYDIYLYVDKNLVDQVVNSNKELKSRLQKVTGIKLNITGKTNEEQVTSDDPSFPIFFQILRKKTVPFSWFRIIFE